MHALASGRLSGARQLAALPHRAEELPALREQPLPLLAIARHLFERLPDVAPAEVVAAVERLDGAGYLLRRHLGGGHRAPLVAPVVEHAVERQVVLLAHPLVHSSSS